MELDKFFTLIAGVGFIIAIAVFMGRLWRVLTNPNVAYKLGRKAHQLGRNTGYAAVDAAHIAGQATGKVENVVGVVGRSFQTGRESTKRSGSDLDDGA